MGCGFPRGRAQGPAPTITVGGLGQPRGGGGGGGGGLRCTDFDDCWVKRLFGYSHIPRVGYNPKSDVVADHCKTVQCIRTGRLSICSLQHISSDWTNSLVVYSIIPKSRYRNIVAGVSWSDSGGCCRFCLLARGVVPGFVPIAPRLSPRIRVMGAWLSIWLHFSWVQAQRTDP